jgi:hypothetical protein
VVLTYRGQVSYLNLVRNSMLLPLLVGLNEASALGYEAEAEALDANERGMIASANKFHHFIHQIKSDRGH